MSGETMTSGACVTPLADLRAAALQHYEALALAACSFSSVIPRAINAYFDAEEAKAPASPPPDVTGEAMTERREHDMRYFVEALARAAQLLGATEGLDTKLLASAHLLNHYAEQARLRGSGPAVTGEAMNLVQAATEILNAYDRGYVSAHSNHAQRAFTALRASLPSEREGQR